MDLMKILLYKFQCPHLSQIFLLRHEKTSTFAKGKNRNAETTINVIAGVRARMALDSYLGMISKMLMTFLICTTNFISY